MSRDPFRDLGLERSADADAVRAARRRLAKEHHPDTGGDEGQMRRINAAAADALQAIEAPPGSPPPRSPTPADGPLTPDDPASGFDGQPTGLTSDVPSFTVEALPAETFEALLVVATWIGEVLDDDPPYRLDTHLFEPVPCWCRLELVPDAGASSVSITIARTGAALPSLEAVRDVWVDQLNRYEW
ncbi:MAG: hypothetical protein HKN44_05020 [Ilumatobacter sp.]|nr:hypothetical protein [Ilumatobacter sp.]